jgi:DNA-binding NarL/FixJ family response regulator
VVTTSQRQKEHDKMLNDRQKAAVQELHSQGLRSNQIAKRLGLTKEYVDAYVKTL